MSVLRNRVGTGQLALTKKVDINVSVRLDSKERTAMKVITLQCYAIPSENG